MTSSLQALASVTSLVAHLDMIITLATESDVPTPVTDAVSDLLAELNTPHMKPPRPLRPHALLEALHTLPSIRRLTSTREQQDAHELLAVLVEAISDEALKVASKVVKLRGVAEVLSLHNYCVEKGSSPTRLEFETAKGQRKRAKGLAQPWEGLIARRRLCRGCGKYGEVRMDTLGGMELPIPIMVCPAFLLGSRKTADITGQYNTIGVYSRVSCARTALRRSVRVMLPHSHIKLLQVRSSPSDRRPIASISDREPITATFE